MNNEILFLLGCNALLLGSILGALVSNALECKKLIRELKEYSYYDKKGIRK